MSNRSRISRLWTSLSLATSLLVGACATPSQYRSERPGRASIFVDGDWHLRIEGTDRHLTGDDIAIYPGLADLVGCVPQSRRYADAAEESRSRVNRRGWLGAGLMLGGLGLGLGGVAYGASQDNPVLAVTGVGVMLAGLIAGLIPLAAAMPHAQQAQASSLDAINSYNDLYATTSGCVGYAGPGAATSRPRNVEPVAREIRAQ